MTTLALPLQYSLVMANNNSMAEDDDDDDDRMVRITTGASAAAIAQSIPDVDSSPYSSFGSTSCGGGGCYNVTGEPIEPPHERPERCSLDSATFVVPLQALLRVSPVFAAMFSGQRFAESKTSEIALQGYSPESVAAFCSFISSCSNNKSSYSAAAIPSESQVAATNHNYHQPACAGDMMLFDDENAHGNSSHGSVRGDDDNVADILRDLNVYDLQDLLLLCEQYEVHQLKHQIELVLASCITVQNAFDMLVLACDTHALHLKRFVEKYASEHFDDLCALGKWNEFRIVSQQTRNQNVEGEMTQTLIDDLSRQFQTL